MSLTPELQTLKSKLALLTPDQRRQAIESLSTDLQDFLKYYWHFWAREEQLLDPSVYNPNQRNSHTYYTWNCGRSFGKTYLASNNIRSLICGPTPESPGLYKRLILIGANADEVRKSMINGDSGLINVHPPKFRPEFQTSTRSMMWPNGATAAIYYATEPEGLRSVQGDLLWLDELAKFRYGKQILEEMVYCMRIGLDPMAIITSTPKKHKWYKKFLELPNNRVITRSSYDNLSNMPEVFKQLIELNKNTRKGRQEIFAEILSDVEGALWQDELFIQTKIPEDLQSGKYRIVIALDPSGTSTGDMCGIIVAAYNFESKLFYVLNDSSLQGTPNEWANKVVALYNIWEADRVVVETNFGGQMVSEVIRTVDPNIPIREVHASKGKLVRAEPIAALYEQQKVSHCSDLKELEDELINYTGSPGQKSPNRLDALVFALTELKPKKSQNYDNMPNFKLSGFHY